MPPARVQAARVGRAALMLITAAALMGRPASVHAQTVNTGRIELSGGARIIGGVAFDDVSASQVTPGGGTRPLFDSQSRLDGSIGPAGSVGVRLTGVLLAEVAFAYNATSVTTRISGDVEGVPDVSVDTPLSQFAIDGGLVAKLRRWRSGAVAPFVTAGAGYVRQLYDGRTLVVTGTAYYVGGGLYYERRSPRPGWVRSTGLRVDGRALFMRDGAIPEGTTGVAPVLTAAAFARF